MNRSNERRQGTMQSRAAEPDAPAAHHDADLVDALTDLFVAAFNARSVARLLTSLADDVCLVSEASAAPLEGRAPVGNHFRRHLDELREADPVNVVAARGSIGFLGVDAYPCAVVFDGRLPASLICLEAVPGAVGAALEDDLPGQIRRIHVIHDRARLEACHTDEPPRFREPMGLPDGN